MAPNGRSHAASAVVAAPDTPAALAALERKISAQQKTIDVLMARVEGTIAKRSSAFMVFEQNLLLEKVVADRTAELREQGARLGAALEELRRAQSQLVQAQKLEAIGALAAGVAHEINTPTQYVGDNVAFLKRAFDLVLAVVSAARAAVAGGAPDDPALVALRAALGHRRLERMLAEIPGAFDEAAEGVARITSIVGALKEFAHPGAGEKELVDLAHAVETTVTVARGEWKYLADIEVDCEPDLPPVPAYRYELSQVVLNMIVNAVHAIGVVNEGSTRKGKIRIALRREEPWIALRVTDDGCGIPAEIRDRIFDPFFTTKPVGKGTGQGLAIAYDTIVEKHGGRIEVDSEVGRGTTFVIHLPLEPAPSSKQRAR